ncbi:MAG: hypothetical protein Q9174_003399 [Haloplaca sp. 1 TL-2023]
MPRLMHKQFTFLKNIGDRIKLCITIMLGKRKASKYVAPIKKRRKGEPAIEEITFDFDAREDYLTGFHKRKLQRAKHAKEEALKKEREDKVAARKVLRENRKADLQKHVESVNAAVREAEEGIRSPNSDEEGNQDGDENEQWSGVEEPEAINHGDDYLDEDRHTVVTVEAVDVSRDGLHTKQDDAQEETDDLAAPSRSSAHAREVNARKDKRAPPKANPDQQPKKRKKKFRYESKAERKVTRFKERSGGKAKAKARRA